MDVVYLLIKTSNDNLEFRYSLRSLQNLKHSRVFVVWHKPKWCSDKVIHIPCNDNHASKYANVRKKYRVICNHPKISDDFILMHDDIYVMNTVNKVQYHILWDLEEHAAIILDRLWENNYYHAIRQVADMFPGGKSYDTHTPVLFNKDKFKYIMEQYWDAIGSKRSIYCNYYNCKWRRLANCPDYNWNSLVDCKVFDINKWCIDPKQLYLSCDNNTFKFIKWHLHSKFPTMSPYEKNVHVKKKVYVRQALWLKNKTW